MKANKFSMNRSTTKTNLLHENLAGDFEMRLLFFVFFVVGCITYFFSNPVIIVHEVEKWHNPLRKYSVTWTFFHVNSLSCFRMKSVFIFQVWNALNALCGNLHYMMIYQRYMMILQQCMLIHCLYILFL